MIAKVNSDIQKGNIGRNNELIDWLKSFKDKVQFKTKQEWSEEDKKRLRNIINELVIVKEDANVRCSERALSDIIADINWLKSIRPQNTWKPSE